MEATFVERLAAARIGRTFNQYAESARLCERLSRYLDSKAEAPIVLVAEAPGYRGTRVSGIPLTSERQLTGSGPSEATATVVHRVLAELGLSEDVLLWNLVPTHPGSETANRPPTRCEIDIGAPFLPRSFAAAGLSPWAGLPTRGFAVPTCATRRTAARPPSARASQRRCWDRVERWSASRSAATRSSSPRR